MFLDLSCTCINYINALLVCVPRAYRVFNHKSVGAREDRCTEHLLPPHLIRHLLDGPIPHESRVEEAGK